MSKQISSPASLRLFYALWPDDATRNMLMQVQQHIGGRRVAYSNLHITLAFLGQQSADVLPVLQDILTRLPSTSLQLRLDQVGYFPRNRIVWAGTHQVPQALFELQHQLTDALRQHGIAYDNRNTFKPHLTIARDAPPPGDLCFDPVTWHASQAVLAASVLGAGGSAYRIVATRNLLEQEWFQDSGQIGSPDAPA